MYSPWRTELTRALSLCLLALVIGGWFHLPLQALAGALFFYLLRHLFQVYRLERWLRRRAVGAPPPGGGVWEDIYLHIYNIKRRHKRRKQRLVQLLDQFHIATVALPDAIVVLGAHDEIEWFNEAASRMFGLRKSDRKHSIGNLVRNPRFINLLRRRQGNEPVSIPAPTDETVFLEIHIIPYGNNLRLMLARNVTQLRHAERMRSDFIANVSHELRTPLTVLKGYLETLQGAERDLPPRLNRSIERMSEQTARMQYLVDGLLYLTRLESGTQKMQVRPVNVPELVRSLCEDLAACDSEAPRIECRLTSNLWVVGDEQELRSAFSNLIVNALKYTPANGLVTVQWSEDERGGRLDVLDTGAGIAAEHVPRLTERFYRVDVEGSRIKAGTGLGLAIVKHVLSRHDGELKIASVLGKGSRFSCCFPAKRLRAPEPVEDVIKVS